MTTMRVVISIMVAGLCALVVVLNWIYVFMDRAHRKGAVPRHVSTVPLVSMMLALMYVLLSSTSIGTEWVWTLPLVDIGNWKWIAAIGRVR